jgi:hypothetical protein
MSLPNLGSSPKLGEIDQVEIKEKEKDSKEQKEKNIEPKHLIDKRGRKVQRKDHLNRLRELKALLPIQNRISHSLAILFTRVFKRVYEPSDPREQYKYLIDMAFEGQKKYFSNIINQIKSKKDPLSIKHKKDKNKINVSYTVFERLLNIVSEQKELFLEDDDWDWEEIMKLQYKSMNDLVYYSRLGFWTFIYTGLEFQRLVKEASKIEKKRELQIEASVLDSLYSSSNVFERIIAIMIDFPYQIVKRLNTFLVAINHSDLISNKFQAGYLFSAWIRYRYSTVTQRKMHYEDFVDYFIRTFGTIHGAAHKDVKEAYNKMIILSLKAVEKRMQSFDVNTLGQKGVKLLNMIEILRSDYDNELVLREHDDEGFLINQPEYSEEAGTFLDWFFTIIMDATKGHHNLFYYRRGKDIVILNQNLYNIVLPTIRGLNEKGEKILIPWY